MRPLVLCIGILLGAVIIAMRFLGDAPPRERSGPVTAEPRSVKPVEPVTVQRDLTEFEDTAYVPAEEPPTPDNLRLHVETCGGEPVESALVRATAQGAVAEPRRESATDARGDVVFPECQGSLYSVDVVFERVQYTVWDLEPGPVHVVRVGGSLTLDVVVIGWGETPLLGTQVLATREDTGQQHFTTTDQLGEAELRLEAGAYTVAAMVEGMEVREQVVLEADMVVVLAPPERCIVTGRIVDPDGAGIVGARVYLGGDNNRSGEKCDVQGVFEVRRVPGKGQGLLRIVAPGFVARQPFFDWPAPVDSPRGPLVDLGSFPLEPGARLLVLVTSSRGGTLAGATVKASESHRSLQHRAALATVLAKERGEDAVDGLQALQPPEELPLTIQAVGVTGDNGVAVLEGLFPERNYRIEVQTGSATRWVDHVTLPEGGEKWMRAVLEPGAELTVSVQCEDPAVEIEGLHVRVWAGEKPTSHAQVRDNVEYQGTLLQAKGPGTATGRCLAPGPCTIQVDSANCDQATVTATLQAGGNEVSVEVRRGQELHGTVIGWSEPPICYQVIVTAPAYSPRSWRSVVDADGSFVVRGLPPELEYCEAYLFDRRDGSRTDPVPAVPGSPEEVVLDASWAQ